MAYQYILLAILLDKIVDVLHRNWVVMILGTMIIQYTGDRSDSLLADLSEWLDKNADLPNGYTFNIKFLLRIRRLVPGGKYGAFSS